MGTLETLGAIAGPCLALLGYIIKVSRSTVTRNEMQREHEILHERITKAKDESELHDLRVKEEMRTEIANRFDHFEKLLDARIGQIDAKMETLKKMIEHQSDLIKRS